MALNMPDSLASLGSTATKFGCKESWLNPSSTKLGLCSISCAKCSLASLLSDSFSYAILFSWSLGWRQWHSFIGLNEKTISLLLRGLPEQDDENQRSHNSDSLLFTNSHKELSYTVEMTPENTMRFLTQTSNIRVETKAGMATIL